MKKLIMLLSTFALLTSCEMKNVEVKTTDVVINGKPIQTYIIDSCEYIGQVPNNLLSHKGNCKYCEKRRAQEIENAIEKLKNN